MPPASSRFFRVFLTVAILANLTGLGLIILGPDGSLYASIAKTMAVNNDFVNLYGNGSDWLDKPHFPFWITALSFKIFGIHYWSYKLPAILFLSLGAWYTYRFAKALYNEEVGQWSTLMLLSALHILVSSMDVRAEPYLLALVIGATFHFYRSLTEKGIRHLLLGSLLAACALMTKGIFALIPIGAAIGGHLLMTTQWKKIFSARWLLAALFISIGILPELYTLYMQFDMHPEKTVFGRKNVSGIRFFFWDSQFGRFFNTGPIKGKGDPFFFVHTMLWAFLPWSVMLFIALYQKTWDAFRRPLAGEWYCFFGAMASFLIFSLSRFQLPHYLNIIFPFFAILTANWLQKIQFTVAGSRMRVFQVGLMSLMAILPIALHVFYQPEGFSVSFWAGAIMVLFLGYWLIRRVEYSAMQRMIALGVLSMAWIFIYLNGLFYPDLLKYQGGTHVARYLNREHPGLPVYQFGDQYSYTLEFDVDQPLKRMYTLSDTATLSRPFALVVKKNEDPGFGRPPVVSVPSFPIAKLNGKFLNPRKRADQLEAFQVYIFR
jgi:4-amino-4-deoxy-L-arabinose transferase-like glycosyltransferase